MIRVMKGSGVDWINSIPNLWVVKKLKYVANERADKLSESTDSDYHFRYVEISDVSANTGVNNYEEMSFCLAPSRARKKVEIGDIIISTVRTYLKAIAMIDDSDDVVVSTGFTVLYSVDIKSNFLKYVTLSDYFVNDIMANSDGVSYPSTTSYKILQQKILIPPSHIQESIANYLDYMCHRIDCMLDLSEERLKLLHELKQSVVIKAVTKGLDSEVEMKDSGIPWIGMVPSDWVICKIKHAYIFHTGGTPDTDEPYFYSGDKIWVNISDLNARHVNDSQKYLSQEGVDAASIPISKKGSLLFSFKLSLGKVSFCSADLYTNEAIATFVEGDNSLNFLYYAAPLEIVQNADENIYGAKLLNQRLIRNAVIALPPRREQDLIADYLDSECSRIDRLIELEECRIEKLDEFKQSIIYEYVTGMKEVPQ